LVVVNERQDRGATKAWLEEANLLNNLQVELLPMSEGYTWSNALNRALGQIDTINAQRVSRAVNPLEYVFAVSVEANFVHETAQAMVSAFEENVGIVGTSFRGLLHGNEVSLGESYRHPRNTGMMIRTSVFTNRFVRDFDNVCDKLGGMEDIDLLTRMLAFTDFRYRMLDLRVPLVVGVNHNQTQKEEREQAAMREIAQLRWDQIERWRKAWQEMGLTV
jgi:hypothetical protein